MKIISFPTNKREVFRLEGAASLANISELQVIYLDQKDPEIEFPIRVFRFNEN